MATYQPIEFFLQDLSDDRLTTWIVDQAGVLRSVFEIASVPFGEDRVIQIGKNSCEISFIDEAFTVTCKQAIHSAHYDEAISFHFNDGTVGLFIRRSGAIKCYNFCFEESPDWNQLITPVETAEIITLHQTIPPKKKDDRLFRVVSRPDLVAGYLGQSAIRNMELLNDSIGEVLFIDEAYSLIHDEEEIVSVIHEEEKEKKEIVSQQPAWIQSRIRIIPWLAYEEEAEKASSEAEKAPGPSPST